MKLPQLMILAQAAEVAVPYLDTDMQRQTEAALAAASCELGKRLQAQALYKADRPSRTLRREAIREQLSAQYHKVRLKRNGQWHVQTSYGSSWMLFSTSNSDAESLLDGLSF